MVNMTERCVHAQTVCTRLFFPHPSQEPGNEAMSLGDQFIVSRNRKGGTGGGVLQLV